LEGDADEDGKKVLDGEKEGSVAPLEIAQMTGEQPHT
jgi:hypothetical protein